MRQETRFPDEQGTALVFTVSKPAELVLRVRIPFWVEAGGRVLLNGKALESFASPGSYLVLKRTWKNGDRLDIALPMGLHLQRLPDAPDIAAIMFGPLVLVGQLGSEGLTNEKVYGPYGPEGDPVAAPELYLKGDDLATSIQPVAGQPLTFRTLNAGKPKDVTLVPFYKLFGQRYAIYWQIHPVER